MAKPPATKAPAKKLGARKTATCAKTQTDKKCLTKKCADKRGTPKAKGTVKPKHGGRIGNPPFEATNEQRIRVEAMVSAGAQQWFIAEDLGVSEKTLTRHFAPELAQGTHRAISKIGASMVGKALAGDQDAGKFVLARIGGWKDRTAVEQSGPDGGPIVYSNEPPRRDLSSLTDKELDQYERLTAKLDARDRPADK